MPIPPCLIASPLPNEPMLMVPLRNRAVGRQKIPHSVAGMGLVELMIVVLIISLLLAMGVPSYQRVQRKAKAATLVNDFRVFATALQSVAHETGAWPTETTAGVIPPSMTNDQLKISSRTKPTLLGGNYDWENNQLHGGIKYRAALTITGTDLTVDLPILLLMDEALDDGNLSTGVFRLGASNGPLYILEP